MRTVMMMRKWKKPYQRVHKMINLTILMKERCRKIESTGRGIRHGNLYVIIAEQHHMGNTYLGKG